MPEQAFQVLGESLTRALIGNDFDLYQSILTLPMRFSPRDGKAYVLSDLAALREDFDLYVSIIRLHGVTDIYRQYLGSSATGPGEAVVTTMTHILVRANLLVAPFQSRLRLVQRPDDAAWRSGVCYSGFASG